MDRRVRVFRRMSAGAATLIALVLLPGAPSRAWTAPNPIQAQRQMAQPMLQNAINQLQALLAQRPNAAGLQNALQHLLDNAMRGHGGKGGRGGGRQGGFAAGVAQAGAMLARGAWYL
jgi:hypothetical protein